MFVANDLKLLEFIGRVGYCNKTHIYNYLQPHLVSQIITQTINELIATKLVVEQNIYNSSYFLLSTQGYKLLGIVPIKGIYKSTLIHDMLVIDLFLWYIKHYPNNDIKIDKEIKRNKNLISNSNIPDIIFDNHIAIEVEISLKRIDRLADILLNYISSESITKVYYYVRSTALASKLVTLSGNHPKLHIFHFDDDITKAQELDKAKITHSNTNSYRLAQINYLEQLIRQWK